MHSSRRQFAAFLLCFGLIWSAPQLLAKKTHKDRDDAIAAPDEKARALHALNRLTFGPRPGDVQRVLAVGVDKWIDLQLHPEKIDDSALDARMAAFSTLRMSTRELAENFPDPQEINQVMNGKRAMPTDSALRAIWQVQLARLEDRKQRKEEGWTSTEVDRAAPAEIATADAAVVKMSQGEDEQESRHKVPLSAELDRQQLKSLSPEQRFNKILSMPAPEQVAFADASRGDKGQDFLEGLEPRQRETLLALNNPAAVVTGELAQAKVLRGVYSERQLDEVMTDFWINHFNVFVDKGLDRLMLTSYERDVIRPHALGRFEDLLVATAESPAMLFYLDNWLSVGPNSAQALGIPMRPGRAHGRKRPPQAQRNNPGKRTSGLNENYGRELLELHTLSVNGGYSQRDVTETAKVFTGWTIDKPAEGGGFKFDPRMHEPGVKFVLGRRIKPKGQEEGLEVLHRLATSPKTAHFISLKLAERFVADDPPAALVDRVAKTFLKKKGDIREVLGTMFHSPEFWDDGSYRAKVKTPLEFIASALRATGAQIDDATPLTRQLNRMGMPVYGAQPPTGYSMKAEAWVSSSALLNRMNFALALTSGKIKGTRVDATQLVGNDLAVSDPSAALSALEASLLAAGVSRETHDSIAAEIITLPVNGSKLKQGNNSSFSMIAGLLLGSPEFQRR